MGWGYGVRIRGKKVEGMDRLVKRIWGTCMIPVSEITRMILLDDGGPLKASLCNRSKINYCIHGWYRWVALIVAMKSFQGIKKQY